MAATVLAAIGAGVAVAVYAYVSGLQKNIAKARKTGLVYLGYSTGQTHFDRLGTETFLVATPGSLTMHTQSAETFPKDVATYGVLELFGKNVLTTEGALWSIHRKVTSASFNEKNAAYTFTEAINQTKGLLNMWFGPDGETRGTTRTIRSLEHDTITWALNIIGYVGFGLRLLWPGQELPKDLDPRLAKYGSLDPPPGHTMTFVDSVALTLERIMAIMVFPEVLLRVLPFRFAKEAYKAKINYVRYMDDAPRDGMDIIGQLVQSKYGENAGKDGSSNTTFKLDDSDIIGNAFIMTVAGHETIANTLYFGLLELANNPAAQRRLQHDIDSIFGTTDPSTWDYETNISPLLASHVSAYVNETLRLVPPVTGIPKVTTPDVEHAITINGRTYVFPAGTSCYLVAVCAYRNPRWWPTRPSKRTGKQTDLDDYLPESIEEEDEIVDIAEYSGFQGSDVSASLYRPVRGSYLPFSDGARSCLGRRIAMVEMAAALAAIFQRYSVELAVDEWASDREEKSQETIGQAETVLTLKLQGGRHVPVRFVTRGKERFVSDPELL
ncbi:cytochrome P450 [Parachaetomium inaequale]|uniref:Cytochrome P450 n=1 Tax=Parachaetomium inaequale TaxID=2588326 RepID=A0AAN6P8S5_9PEZI|nr:cytochrome P450 [Parachaetomium inaequale]